MKLLLDEMLSPSLAQQLRARGHDVLAVAGPGALRSALDPAVFELAQQEGRVVVTKDLRDYRRLARESARAGTIHAGLVLVRDRAFPEGHPRTRGRLLHALHALLEANPDLQGREHWLS